MSERHARVVLRRDRGDEYTDLAEAYLRGGLSGSGELEPPTVRPSYILDLDRWDLMLAELLLSVVVDAGSAAEASRVLDLPVAALEARLRWVGAAPGCVREAYVVGIGSWRQMSDELLLSIVEDAGSARKAAVALNVSRATLTRWVRRARERRG